MPDYEKMYFTLFNEVTDAIEKLTTEIEKLKRVQIQAEKLYIEGTSASDIDGQEEQ